MMRFWTSLLLMPIMAHATTTEVFKTSLMELNDVGLSVNVCNVDDYKRLTTSLTKSIENKEHKTFSLTEMAPELARINEAAKCQQSMLNYEIKKLPAIVFNQKKVIYGEFDVHAALSFLKRRVESL